MDFAELLALLIEPGDDGPPATIYDDLSTAHSDELGGRDGKIEELMAANDALQAEVTRLKVDIYDKLMSQGEPEGDENDDADENDGDEDESEEGIDSLFEDRE